MRADRKEIDFLPPAGGVGVDMMKVEVSPADRAFVLIFVKAGAILAALHALHLLNEVYLSPTYEKSEREVEKILSVLPFTLVALFCTCTLLLWVDDGGNDNAPRATGPDLNAGHLQLESKSADLGTVQGVQEGLVQISGHRSKVDLQETGKGRCQAAMKLDFHW
ncbi:I-leader protein [Human mastadenovirus F]|uniref:I-leader protein n=1 Tax=Human mastadenovirus F TaxID=130309 RepID=A0A7U3RXD1_9ADEN|nr:I-leader protein [Human mastadenovirus F]